MTNEERLDDLRATKFALKKLMECDGWKDLVTFYQAVKMARRNSIFGLDSRGMDGLIDMGQMKSELAGMDFIMSAPQNIFDETDMEEKGLLEEMNDDNQQTDA